jgi:hypothetical protein
VPPEIFLNALAYAACFAALLPAPGWGSLDPADPEAPTPAPSYRSVFQDTPRGVEENSEDWRRANAEVGQFLRGHIDLLKWENAQPASGQASPPAAAPALQVHPGAPSTQQRRETRP